MNPATENNRSVTVQSPLQNAPLPAGDLPAPRQGARVKGKGGELNGCAVPPTPEVQDHTHKAPRPFGERGWREGADCSGRLHSFSNYDKLPAVPVPAEPQTHSGETGPGAGGATMLHHG